MVVCGFQWDLCAAVAGPNTAVREKKGRGVVGSAPEREETRPSRAW